MEKLYESDQSYPHAGLILGGFILLVSVLTILPYWIFAYDREAHHLVEKGDQRDRRMEPRIQAIPPPRLQARPELDAAAYKQQQLRILNSYGWSDRDRGLVRIPIEEAIDRYESSARSSMP